MYARTWLVALGASLLIVMPASGEIIKGTMSVRGAEMS
jgi:hypothetical protein